MSFAKKITLHSLVAGCLLFTPLFAQFEFQDDTLTIVTHPLLHHQPPLRVAESALAGRVDPSGFDALLGARFQFALDSMRFAHGLMGASAAVILPEKGVWKGAGGFSNPVSNDSLRPEMLMEIDSNTKSFVAAIILQMVDEGLLSLEDPISDWLPPFANVDSTMTIRQILQHTGGVSDFLNDNPLSVVAILSNPAYFWTPEYSLSYVLAPNFPPGASWSYSNTGYTLAGMIIREITGSDSFAIPLNQRLLDPLGLDNMFMELEEPVSGEIAHAWNDLNGDGILDDLSTFPRTSWMSAAWTAGAIISTAEDLARWSYLLHGDQVLSPAAMAQMRATVPIPGTSLTYGLGIYTYPVLGKTLWGHDGGGLGFNSQTLYYGERGTALAVIINQRGGTAWAGDILTELFREVLAYYQFPHDHPYALSSEVSIPFLAPGTETLTVTARLLNPENRNVQVDAVYATSDGSISDTLRLFDDGLHGDSLANDGIFGGTVGPVNPEFNYSVDIHTSDLDSAFSHVLEDAAHFTTVGPVVYAEHEVSLVATGISLILRLRNESSSGIAKDIKARIATSDTSIQNILNNDRPFGNIAPGQVRQGVGNYLLRSENPPSSLHLTLEIFSEGHSFWRDTLDIVVGLEAPVAELPRKFELSQNYPNPFNPVTTIEFFLPENAYTSLRIYNLLGEVVEELVGADLPAGRHRYQWNADRQASGVYYYRLTAKKFSAVKKLVLLR